MNLGNVCVATLAVNKGSCSHKRSHDLALEPRPFATRSASQAASNVCSKSVCPSFQRLRSSSLASRMMVRASAGTSRLSAPKPELSPGCVRHVASQMFPEPLDRIELRRSGEAVFSAGLRSGSHAPKQMTTDDHASYPRAVRGTLGNEVLHRCNHYLNNQLEQDHRAIKQRHYPLHGFGNFASASRFCRAFDEVRQFFRMRSTPKQKVSLAFLRETFCQRISVLKAILSVV